MTALPKPARRAPKPRKRIPRGAHPRGSRTPVALQEHRKLVQRADLLWSFIVRQRSPLCVRCRLRGTADADHLISRRYRATRWNTEIGAPLCKGCHMLVTSDAAEHVRLGISVMGRDRWELLNLAKDAGKCDPALAIMALEAEVRAKGLTALAVDRGIMCQP
jgi:hypothetical protein